MAKSYDEYRLGEPYEPPRRKGLKVFAIIAALMAITILPALAAKGGQGKGHNGTTGGSTSGSGSLTLKMVSDANGNGLPNWNDSITFDVSTTATTEPHVNVTCSQNGAVVYGAATGYYDGYPWPWTQVMTLRSQSWTSGAADCAAVLSSYSGTKVTNLATLNFHVDA
jgi:hypothetical protein